ncbi:GMC oxidoreductase [Cnuella takakiae]|nr:GMC family oxidoreductase [Cnuella takakiae]
MIIVGSGLGGAFLAKYLDPQLKVLLIEAGGATKKSSDVVNFEEHGRSFNWPETRSIELGGTSNLWHSVLSPLDPVDFGKREWIPKSGWPITRDDLEPFYQKAAADLGISDYKYFNAEEAKKSFADDHSPIRLGKAFEIKIFQQPEPQYRVRTFLNRLSNVTILTDTVCLEVCGAEDDRRKMKGVKCFSLRNGAFEFYEGRVIVLSAGALETPRILLNSTTIALEGVANVGRYLQDHPMGNFKQLKFRRPTKARLFSDFRYKPNTRIKAGVVLSESAQRQLKLPNHNFFLRPSFVEGINDKAEEVKLSLLSLRDYKVSLKQVYTIMSNINLARQILAYKTTFNVVYKYADLFLMSEQVPNFDSSVALSQIKDQWGYPIAKVNWQLTDQDIAGMRKYVSLVDECFDTDLATTSLGFEMERWLKIFSSAAHHVGTCRMGVNAADAVVDADCLAFGTSNLYVADGSVFTTSGNVNSGLTIIALAIRLAGHINMQYAAHYNSWSK